MKITLKAARVNAGLTQKEAAHALGISNVTLANWERGRSSPKQTNVRNLCSLYRIPYDEIFFAADNAKSVSEE